MGIGIGWGDWLIHVRRRVASPETRAGRRVRPLARGGLERRGVFNQRLEKPFSAGPHRVGIFVPTVDRAFGVMSGRSSAGFQPAFRSRLEVCATTKIPRLRERAIHESARMSTNVVRRCRHVARMKRPLFRPLARKCRGQRLCNSGTYKSIFSLYLQRTLGHEQVEKVCHVMGDKHGNPHAQLGRALAGRRRSGYRDIRLGLLSVPASYPLPWKSKQKAGIHLGPGISALLPPVTQAKVK